MVSRRLVLQALKSRGLLIWAVVGSPFYDSVIILTARILSQCAIPTTLIDSSAAVLHDHPRLQEKKHLLNPCNYRTYTAIHSPKCLVFSPYCQFYRPIYAYVLSMALEDMQPITEGGTHMMLIQINIYIWKTTGIVFFKPNIRYPTISQMEFKSVGWTTKANWISSDIASQSLET